jgi:hypothetical protein
VIWIAFLFAAVPALVLPVFLPSLRLLFFAPFLVLIYYKRPLSHCLWIAFGCGLFMDLLAPFPRLGILALNYCLTSLIVYRSKAHFFEDGLTSLPVMTFLFAEVSTLIQIILLKVFATAPTLSLYWVGTDLIVMPLADALYAWIWFAFPAHLLRRRPSRTSAFFLGKR